MADAWFYLLDGLVLVLSWVVPLGLAAGIWRRANRDGERIGRAVAWFCSGGLGWMFARAALERVRMKALRADFRREMGRRMSGPAVPGRPLAWMPEPASYGRWQNTASYGQMLAARDPARCGVYRAVCPRCRHLGAGQPSPVGCLNPHW